MKRFCLTLLAFIPFLLFLYAALLYTMGSFTPAIVTPNILNKEIVGHTQTRLKEVKDFGVVDILFLGSSHAYRGFDNRIFDKAGFRSFNLGTSAQTPLQTQILLQRYLDRLHPKVIVYEVFPTTFSIDGVESFTDILANDSIDLSTLKIVMAQHNMRLYNTLVFQFITDPFNKNLHSAQPKQIDDDTYISGGYVEKKMSYFKYMHHPEQKWDFNDDQFKAFGETLAFIKQRDIKIILVFAPITSSFYHAHTNNASFDDRMKKYGEYYNYNEILNMNDSLHFLDEHHLNQDGVELFNESLAKTLKDWDSEY